MRNHVIPFLLLAIFGTVTVLPLFDREDTEEQAASRDVPRLNVARLDGEGDYALARLETAPSPTLLWFWAPWCEYCNQEAPDLEAFAKEHGDEVQVVAIGGADDPENGLAFAEEHGLRTPTMLFDVPESAFDAYKVKATPTAILLDDEGRERKRWVGEVDPNELLAEARTL
jgi:thiol-disulfide isomerase/thioredoxin